MWKGALKSAAITGLFCSVFAIVVSQITPMLALTQVAGVSFISGFLGSLVARAILRK